MKKENTSLSSISVASLSSLLFGLGLTSFEITEKISAASEHKGLSTIAIANVFLGGVVGAIILEFYKGGGPKKLIIVSSMLNLLGYIFILVCPKIQCILIARIIIGVGNGLSGLTVPYYIFELSPTSYKGLLSSLHPMNINLGIVIGQALSKFNTEALWIFGIGIIGVLSFISLSMSLFIVNLAKKETKGKTIIDLIRKPEAFKSTKIVLILHLAQHLSGIDYVVVFLGRILKDTYSPFYYTLGIMSLSIPANIVCSVLLDRYGRKPLMVMSCSLITISCLLLTFCGRPEFSIVLFVVGYNLGLSNVPWLVPNELAPSEYIAPLSSLGVQVNWLSAFFVVQIFIRITESLKDKTWLIYGGLMAAISLFTLVFVPETKGKEGYDFVK
ncbi:Solute carrier family 2, facilitated glucose transporter member 3 [Nosema granulosis]|uniref:Solute carrier family 2, facilitated glucose transporter member 3 n=1 Tax=Nosema granulosis TaxID=83296 RepID=A0A9P6GYI3_9MICR|nr:Solute carrier family 2, facilitated glucose transporter member 3 [Nosema granulosis]